MISLRHKKKKKKKKRWAKCKVKSSTEPALQGSTRKSRTIYKEMKKKNGLGRLYQMKYVFLLAPSCYEFERGHLKSLNIYVVYVYMCLCI